MGNSTIEAHYLLYSRTERADYRWLYGGARKGLEERLTHFTQKNLMPRGPSTNSVACLWFEDSWAILLDARLSEQRKDEVNRDIVDYSYFAWDTATQFAEYVHLHLLLHRLQAETRKAVAGLPDTYTAPPKKEQTVQLHLSAADAPMVSQDEEWCFPNNAGTDKFLETRMIVRVPGNWSVSRAVYPVRNLRISDSYPVSVALSLPEPRVLSDATSWIISDTTGVIDAPVAIRELPPLKATSAKARPPASAPVQSRADESDVLVHALQREEQFEDDLNSRRGGIWARVAAPFSRTDPQVQSRKICAKLNLMIVPVNTGVPGVAAVAWGNLLREIDMFFDGTAAVQSQAIRDEWVRRLRALKNITMASVFSNRAWESEFEDLCVELEILIDGVSK